MLQYAAYVGLRVILSAGCTCTCDAALCVPRAQCADALRAAFPDMMKPDGSKYKGSVDRAVLGALSSTGVFVKNEVRTTI